MPESRPNSSPAQRKSWLWVVVLGMTVIPGIVSLLYLRSAPRKPLDSLAVLPFSYSPDESSFEPLSGKITEELISRLAQLAQDASLRIAPLEAVASYSFETRPAQTVGHELGVRAIVRGRIERREDRIRISAELVDSGNNAVLWSRQYELSGEEDVAAFQEEIARHLASFIRSQ